MEEENDPTLESIRVTPPTTTTYTVGDPLDLTGMTVTGVYSDGSEQAITAADCAVTGYDGNTAGKQTVTVMYQGKTATFTVTVNEPVVEYVDITFVAGTDHDVIGMPQSQTVVKGESAAAVQAPVCIGFTFAGWYNGNTAWDFSAPVNEDVELVAHWNAKQYTVKYIVENGDDPANGVYTAVEGVFGSFALATPVKAHYTFDGWYADRNYTGTKRAALSYADLGDDTEFTFYGKFTAETYTVSYEFGGSDQTYGASWAEGYTPVTS